MLLTCRSNFIQIGYYLLFNQKNYFLYTILDYKNLKFKYLNGDIAIDLWFSWNFVSVNDIIRTYNPTVRFLKFTLNIKIHFYIEEFEW